MNVITHTFVGRKCLTEIKIQILYDRVDHTRFHIVEMGCQMVQLLSAHIVGPTMFVNLTPTFGNKPYKNQAERFLISKVLLFEKISLRFLKKWFLFHGFLL